MKQSNQRTPVAAFIEGFTLEQSKKYHAEYNLPHLRPIATSGLLDK